MSESGLLFDACSSTIVTSAPCYTSPVSWSRGNIVLVKHNISRATDHTDQDQVHATAQHLWSLVNNEIFFLSAMRVQTPDAQYGPVMMSREMCCERALSVSICDTCIKGFTTIFRVSQLTGPSTSSCHQQQRHGVSNISQSK